MEKILPKKWSQELWFAILTSLALFSVLFLFDYSSVFSTDKRVTLSLLSSSSSSSSCSGKYIYVHNLPPRFNSDLLTNCKLLTRGTEQSMCPYIANNGLGPAIEDPQGLFSNQSWFNTNQFMLELIFHTRINHYKCLTNDSSLASAVFVPFYAGLDASLTLWSPNITTRDTSAHELIRWLTQQPEWARLHGRDHFLVAGRIAWDFRRTSDEAGSWGSKLRFLPPSENMSMLAVEASSWRNDYAIPYPTRFHPDSYSSVQEWQARVRARTRAHTFTFAGAPRLGSVRGRVIEQCQNSSRCEFVDCLTSSCDDPNRAMSVFMSSSFCLQPPGDSYTRRSVFDAILAGCIPVFFHPGTAYSQYLWHLPENYTKYSVYIPAREVGDLSDGLIEKILLGISKEEEERMREEVIGLIPRIVYAGPGSGFEGSGFEDAFDLAITGVLARIEGVRKVIREGKDPSVGFAEENSYKYTFSDWNKRGRN